MGISARAKLAKKRAFARARKLNRIRTTAPINAVAMRISSH